MRRFLKFVAVIFLVSLAVAGWVAYALYVPYGNFLVATEFSLIFRKARLSAGIARLLAENGVIRNRYPFLLLARRRRQQIS